MGYYTHEGSFLAMGVEWGGKATKLGKLILISDVFRERSQSKDKSVRINERNLH